MFVSILRPHITRLITTTKRLPIAQVYRDEYYKGDFPV